jgi:hypothetical protein
VLGAGADVAGEAAVRRHAQDLVQVVVGVAGPAEVVGGAGLDGVDRHPVADGHPGRLVAHRDDDAGELVAEDQRALAVGRADRAAAVVVLEVGAADAARGDLDDDVRGAGRRVGHVLQPEVLHVVEDGSLHGASPPLSGRTGRGARRA